MVDSSNLDTTGISTLSRIYIMAKYKFALVIYNLLSSYRVTARSTMAYIHIGRSDNFFNKPFWSYFL